MGILSLTSLLHQQTPIPKKRDIAMAGKGTEMAIPGSRTEDSSVQRRIILPLDVPPKISLVDPDRGRTSASLTLTACLFLDGSFSVCPLVWSSATSHPQKTITAVKIRVTSTLDRVNGNKRPDGGHCTRQIGRGAEELEEKSSTCESGLREFGMVPTGACDATRD